MYKDEAIKKIEQEKESFIINLKTFYSAYDQTIANSDNMSTLIGDIIASHTKLLNTVNYAIQSLHKEYNLYVDDNLKASLEDSVINFVFTSLQYCDTLKVISEKTKLTTAPPSEASYNLIQSFISTFSSKETKEKLNQEFEKRNISTAGFKQKIKPPMNEEGKSKQKLTSIIVGAIAIAIVITTLLLKSNISAALQVYLHILFAIGCGGISAALIGTITVNIRSSYEIMAVGGFAVFVLIYFFLPFKIPEPSFSVTIFLKNRLGDRIPVTNVQSLQLKLDENYLSGIPQPNSNAFLFKPIAESFKSKNVELDLESSKYTFDSSKKYSIIPLDPGGTDVKLIRDTNSLMVKGTVTYLTEPQSMAKITVENEPSKSTRTDSVGKFTIKMPEIYDNESVRVLISKSGFKTLTADLKLNEQHQIPIFKK